MTVTEGVTVDVLPNATHNFLMTTKEVAKGYGVSDYAILKNKLSLSDELIEGKHFVIAITIGNSNLPAQLRCAHNAILWTKRGIVRLGFTMRSDRARLFRDWAEELIINPRQVKKPRALSPAPSGRRINRLTPGRVADILADVCLIKDDELRERIAMKIKGGVDYGC